MFRESSCRVDDGIHIPIFNTQFISVQKLKLLIYYAHRSWYIVNYLSFSGSTHKGVPSKKNNVYLNL